MNYTIDIIDTQDDTHVVQLNHAEKSSLLLHWQGGDSKDGLAVVGSKLDFTLEVNVADSKDGYFRHLFTGDETRYKVRLYYTDTDETVWTGHLLPDEYSEPYTNDTFYCGFTATDGLGRLKGKYLPDRYYENEYSVIEFYTQLLLLTGLELELYMAPAILNSVQKDYGQIYLNGLGFEENDKKKDAYVVLKELLTSMLCVCYQADNRWYIEGLNRRHQKKIKYYHYGVDGVFVKSKDVTRLTKYFRGVGVPYITLVAPYKEIEVSHKREGVSLPGTIAQEKNEGWAVGEGVYADIHPTYWFSNGDFYARAVAPGYKVILNCRQADVFDNTKFVSLKNGIYFRQYEKLSFVGKFSLSKELTAPSGSVVKSAVSVQFFLNNNTLFARSKTFDKQSIEIRFDMYVESDGILDLRILQPYHSGAGEHLAEYVSLDMLELSVIGFEKQKTHIDLLEGDFTAKKDLKLTWADDATGFSKAFRLSKLQEPGAMYFDVPVPIQYGFTQGTKNYSVLQLYGANIIADNRYSVSYNGNAVNVKGVTYNFANGEEMVVETEEVYTNGQFIVRVYRNAFVMGNRDHWEKWTDAVFPVEENNYLVTASNVMRRMFESVHERVEFEVEDALKFNDLVKFYYSVPSDYIITNLTWDLDRGHSSGIMLRGVYRGVETNPEPVDNLPPIVDCGPDIKILMDNRFDPFTVSATAYDPDGYISHVNWEFVNPNTSGVIETPNELTTRITGANIVYQNVVLRCVVTDNDGLMASDEVSILPLAPYTVVLSQILNNQQKFSATQKYTVRVAPELEEGHNVKLTGSVMLKSYNMLFYGINSQISITKNGTVIFFKILNEQKTLTETLPIEFNYRKGDNIEILMQIYAGTSSQNFTVDPNVVHMDFEIQTMIFQTGQGVVSGLPQKRELKWVQPGTA